MNIPDITKLTWPLNIALIGAVFSVFALIYNPYYIYFGFITLVFGVIGHLIDNMYNSWLKEEGWKPKFVFISQIILTGVWILTLLIIYR